jgi:hypothetical protein
MLGPLGVALIGHALATSPGPGDGAILYSLPVLWTTIFFGLGCSSGSAGMREPTH